MATRAKVIRRSDDAYELLRLEAARRGVEPDALAENLLRADLAPASWQGFEEALAALAGLRGRLPEIDGVALARDTRAELEAR
jgi:hypothetical protein